jgi:hypothetical protein
MLTNTTHGAKKRLPKIHFRQPKYYLENTILHSYKHLALP